MEIWKLRGELGAAGIAPQGQILLLLKTSSGFSFLHPSPALGWVSSPQAGKGWNSLGGNSQIPGFAADLGALTGRCALKGLEIWISGPRALHRNSVNKSIINSRGIWGNSQHYFCLKLGKKIKISEDKDGKGPLQGKPLCLMTFLGL